MPPDLDHLLATGMERERDHYVLTVLLQGPEDVRNALASHYATKDAAAAAERDLKRIRLALMGQVASETIEEADAKGTPRIKARFANVEAREAELAARLEVDADAARLRERVEHLRRAEQQSTINLEYARARLDGARAAARILGGRP